MKCPTDGTALVITHRRRVELDYCPTCHGVWLDRGELEKLIELTLAAPDPDPEPDRDRDDDHMRFGRRRTKSRKESWLADLFDLG